MKDFYTAGIIGTGRIGFSLGFDKKRERPASHTAALKGNKRVKITAGCDINSEALNRWKKFNPDTEVFSNMKDYFASENVPDITVIAVNESAHLEAALMALESKTRLIILEKPVALNLEEGMRIKAAAERSSTAVLVNHERRFADDYRLAKSIMQSGRLGEIQSIRGSLRSSLPVYSPDGETTGAYSLLHDGTHLIDIINFLADCEKGAPNSTLELPLSIQCTKSRDTGNIVNLSVFWKTEKGIHITAEISGKSSFFEFALEITGTSGKIAIGNGFAKEYTAVASKLYSGFKSLEENKETRFPRKTRYFANVVKNAVGFLDGRETLISTLDDGIAVMKAIEEIKEKINRESR